MSEMPRHPYVDRPERAFWRKAVSDRHWADIKNIWTPPDLTPSDRFATAGSCFAQHIGRFLQRSNCTWLDLEPAPDFLDQDQALHHGFGIYSCRYGNVYTTRQLVQLMQEAFDDRTPSEQVWAHKDRFHDALRPLMDPAGHASADTVLELRRLHLDRVREMFESLDVFVFTMGLTEVWTSIEDGTAFPSAPGVTAGTWDPDRYALCTLSHAQCLADLDEVWMRLGQVNPTARMILTVSPVPLVATATEDHVLPATMMAKSTLRSVAGEMAAAHGDVHYFPSYEIIAGHPTRAAFFESDLRSVNASGVEHVMRSFFAGWHDQDPDVLADIDDEVICDEEGVAI